MLSVLDFFAAASEKLEQMQQFKTSVSGGWRDAQRLRTLAIFTEDLGSVSSIHMQLTPVCYSSSVGSTPVC